MTGDPFDVSDLPPTALGRAVMRLARPLVDRVLGLDELSRLYRTLPPVSRGRLEARALDALRIDVEVSPDELARIPPRGPCIVVANHPHGIGDGLALATVVSRVRSDVKLVANRLLARVPELRDSCVFVDPFGGPDAAVRSWAGLRAAHRWLRSGGILVAFPAGEVAHERSRSGHLQDEPWQSTVCRLALATGALLVPVYVAGENSRVFYRAGRLHPRLRTALLGRELLRQRGTVLRLRVGDPILTSAGSDPSAMLRDARLAVDAMQHAVGRHAQDQASTEAQVAEEIARLPETACLASSGPLRVYCAEAGAIPQTLRELGRLRERTFRAVGEGTGQSVDLDAFDTAYLHLICWDSSARQIVGAYRMGRTDQLVAAHGIDALYTRTLFRYDQTLIDRLGPALELGRSFVRQEYQRSHGPLMLLWMGIGRFVARHPHYRVLFGPVSISARYSDASHQLLIAFLEQNHRHEALAELVQAAGPTPHGRARSAPSPGPAVVPRTPEEASRLVAALEPDGKGMPVLLRQYLKLNARVLAFNVDPAFGNALDALMMVDLASVDRAILSRYLGKDEAARFLATCRSIEAA